MHGSGGGQAGDGGHVVDMTARDGERGTTVRVGQMAATSGEAGEGRGASERTSTVRVRACRRAEDRVTSLHAAAGRPRQETGRGGACTDAPRGGAARAGCSMQQAGCSAALGRALRARVAGPSATARSCGAAALERRATAVAHTPAQPASAQQSRAEQSRGAAQRRVDEASSRSAPTPWTSRHLPRDSRDRRLATDVIR